MNRVEQVELLSLLKEKERRQKLRKIWTYFPETGPCRRELYTKHMEFFTWGANRRVRLVLAANRIGKTETMGGYEVACHLTGIYPDWWTGRRYDRPVKVWAAGDTSKTTRDSIQMKMIGEWDDRGTGMILGEKILSVSPKAGLPNAAEIVTVRHVSGGTSRLFLKSFDQGRRSFQASEPDIIWLDEECPRDIYEESLTRTATNNGMVIMTFTPLMGLTELVESMLEGGDINSPLNNETKQIITATWDDVPHLTEATKAALLAEYQPFQRAARSKGVPQLGAGAIYPVDEDDVVVEDFPIPDSWPRWYGMDVGWNRTAAVHMAWDRDNDVIYEYFVHYMGEAQPPVHVQGIQAPGKWIPGAIDPAARGRGQADGLQLLQMYTDLGLNLAIADNGVSTGIYEVWQRLSSGRLKTFKRGCQPLIQERRVYRRDVKGHVVKVKDHALDAERYGAVSKHIAITKPVERQESDAGYVGGGQGWMQ